MNEKRLVLVAYDIRAPKRLRSVARLLEDHGERLQRSLFVTELTPRRQALLERALKDRIDPSEDDVRLYPVSRSPIGEWIGKRPGGAGVFLFGGLTDRFLASLRPLP